MSDLTDYNDLHQMDEEQLPVAKHKTHGFKHFAGLFAAEHVAATEFLIGATFVALGAKTMDIIIGLLIGNILAVLSWTLVTVPIAIQARLSLYTYLNKIAGNSMSKLYNWANVLIFTVISAAMITVSATAVRFAFNIPPQLDWYPTNPWFVLIVMVVGIVAVFVAMFGFKAVSDFSGICAPWLFVMFGTGAMVLLPALSLHVLGTPLPADWAELINIGDTAIWKGVKSDGSPGIGLIEVIGFGWAANTITHFGLIDMALFRFARKTTDGLASSTGMLFGHYFAWMSAGIMGAGAAILLGTTIDKLDPGDVAFKALGWSGFVIVIVAGWTTAITNLYRAGLAAQAVFSKTSRQKTTLVVGIVMVIVACFPFVFSQILPLLTYAGLLVVPVGGIVFAEHQVFPKIGYTRYWAKYQNYANSKPAILSWVLGLVFGFGLNFLDVMSFFYLFIPTWAFTVVVYTVLAGKAGAKQSYPEEEKAEQEFQTRVANYQAILASQERESVADVSFMTKALKAISMVSLIITSVLAVKVLCYSPTEEVYIANREVFYNIGIICTIIYFVTAYWAFNRSQNA